MRMRNPKRSLRFWRRAAIVSVLLFLSTCWILIDTLLAITEEESGRVIEIPQLCGMHEDEISPLDGISLRTSYRYDEEAARGVVIAQSPRAGSLKRLRSEEDRIELLLTVSLGRESYELPHFWGQDAREAEAWLRAHGLFAEIQLLFDDARAGLVLSQSPLSGARVERGACVTLWVGAAQRTDSVRVPNLIGTSRAEALLLLAAQGLRVGEIYEAEADAEAGTVVAQSRLQGTLVPAGTKVSITVAEAKEEEE